MAYTGIYKGEGGVERNGDKGFSNINLKRGVDTLLHPPFDATDLGELD